ncbi:MAG: hypothetical protein HOK50_04040 [Kordiimonadaceae bacterium]|nr:hypothetical protein [Kordiimonadaceae bacterium]
MVPIKKIVPGISSYAMPLISTCVCTHTRAYRIRSLPQETLELRHRYMYDMLS